MSRLNVLKTYKIYIGGQFPRTESGRYYKANGKDGEAIANVCLSSRKDVRNAVVAARKASKSWSERAPFNRGQIVYRIAEMLESRRNQFESELLLQGMNESEAKAELDRCIDRLVYYAGWCDKYQQVSSSVNPVSSPHFNFSVLEASGIVGVLAPPTSPLLGLISTVIPSICGGNVVVAIASEQFPLCAVSFAEVLNSSDVPGGVVNILTGNMDELADPLSSHMEVNALVCSGIQTETLHRLKEHAVENLKRFHCYSVDWTSERGQHLSYITDVQETKTTWHPIEKIGGASSGY
jgi:acyl-CoA reductase-like NAD-dependent aldehyde dehydrogenase